MRIENAEIGLSEFWENPGVQDLAKLRAMVVASAGGIAAENILLPRMAKSSMAKTDKSLTTIALERLAQEIVENQRVNGQTGQPWKESLTPDLASHPMIIELEKLVTTRIMSEKWKFQQALSEETADLENPHKSDFDAVFRQALVNAEAILRRYDFALVEISRTLERNGSISPKEVRGIVRKIRPWNIPNSVASSIAHSPEGIIPIDTFAKGNQILRGGSRFKNIRDWIKFRVFKMKHDPGERLLDGRE